MIAAGLLMSVGSVVAQNGEGDSASDDEETTLPVLTLQAELRLPPTAGGTAYRYVPATTIEQGQEINYTVRIANPDTAALPKPTVILPLPTNTHYVPESATGAGADIQFSVDGGQTFAKPGALRSPANAERVASAGEYTHIRWQLRYALAPKAVLLARFRAVFE
jgi:uncharacterized repeat protein (TIGR01451 family)